MLVAAAFGATGILISGCSFIGPHGCESPVENLPILVKPSIHNDASYRILLTGRLDVSGPSAGQIRILGNPSVLAETGTLVLAHETLVFYAGKHLGSVQVQVAGRVLTRITVVCRY